MGEEESSMGWVFRFFGLVWVVSFFLAVLSVCGFGSYHYSWQKVRFYTKTPRILDRFLRGVCLVDFRYQSFGYT